MIRLDAVGYAVKRAGSNCFMMEETFDFIRRFSARARRTALRVRYTRAVSARSRQPSEIIVPSPSSATTTANGSTPTSRNAYQSDRVA